MLFASIVVMGVMVSQVSSNVLDSRNYTEFERTMIINQRQIIDTLNKLVPTVESCRETPPAPYTLPEAPVPDNTEDRLPDFEHNMIHYQRTIMGQIDKVVLDAQDCRQRTLAHKGPKEIIVPLPNATVTCQGSDVLFEYQCLRYRSSAKSWEGAEFDCKNQGGTLAEPSDMEEFTKITTQARQNNRSLSRSIWIGANGLNYKRPRGSPVRAYGINCPTIHFFPGSGDKSSDFPCRYRRSYVCQLPGIKP